MNGPRLMVIGTHVATVQQVSRYCLYWSAQVLPVYGLPAPEEIELFVPEAVIACTPLSGDLPIEVPCILWSPLGLQGAVSTQDELYDRLCTLLPTLPR